MIVAATESRWPRNAHASVLGRHISITASAGLIREAAEAIGFNVVRHLSRVSRAKGSRQLKPEPQQQRLRHLLRALEMQDPTLSRWHPHLPFRPPRRTAAMRSCRSSTLHSSLAASAWHAHVVSEAGGQEHTNGLPQFFSAASPHPFNSLRASTEQPRRRFGLSHPRLKALNVPF